MLSLPGTNGASKLVGFSLIFSNIFSLGTAKLIGNTLCLFSNNSLLKYNPDLIYLSSIILSSSPSTNKTLLLYLITSSMNKFDLLIDP